MLVASSRRPTQSSFPALPRFDSGSIRQPRIPATIPIGTLTKKIQDQCRFCRIRPPTTGPRIGASIAGITTMPIPRPMRFGPATSAMIIWATGMIIPPPTPWRTRKRISEVLEPAIPQSAEPIVQIAAEGVEGDVDDRRVEDRHRHPQDHHAGDLPDVGLDPLAHRGAVTHK